MQNIKNIIFDLGGVILNIDFKQTELAFAKLGVGDFNAYYTLQTSVPLFHDLETGNITTAIFYDKLRELLKLPLPNEDIQHAWNALLLDFPKERIEWLKSIRKKYKIYLLSNTNQIHYDAFTALYKQQIGDGNFNDLFIKAFYSHEIRLRKPAKESFEFVLKQEDLIADETVFIDDLLPNIESAKKIGLQTIYLPATQTVIDLDL